MFGYKTSCHDELAPPIVSTAAALICVEKHSPQSHIPFADDGYIQDIDNDWPDLG